MTQLLPLNSVRKPSMSASVNPVVPTTACTPCIASHGTVTRAASATVKSTTTSQPASASDRRSPVTLMPCRVSPTALRSMAATSSRSGSRPTATQVARPIFPPAPTTPTLICAMSDDRSRTNPSARADADRDRLGGQHAIDRALHRHLVDGGPSGNLLVDRPNGTGGDQLAAVARHAGACVFVVELGTQQSDHLVAVFRLGAGVHLERAGVGIRRHTRVHRVRQATTLADLL